MLITPAKMVDIAGTSFENIEVPAFRWLLPIIIYIASERCYSNTKCTLQFFENFLCLIFQRQTKRASVRWFSLTGFFNCIANVVVLTSKRRNREIFSHQQKEFLFFMCIISSINAYSNVNITFVKNFVRSTQRFTVERNFKTFSKHWKAEQLKFWSNVRK